MRRLLLLCIVFITSSNTLAMDAGKEADAIFRRFSQETLTFEEVKKWVNDPAHSDICETFYSKYSSDVLNSGRVKDALTTKILSSAVPVATTQGFFSDIENCCAALWLLEQQALRKKETERRNIQMITHQGHAIVALRANWVNLLQALWDVEHLDVARMEDDTLSLGRIIINNGFQALTIFQMFSGCIDTDARPFQKEAKNREDCRLRPLFEQKLRDVEARENDIKARKPTAKPQTAKSSSTKLQQRNWVSSLRSTFTLKRLIIAAGALAAIGGASWFAYNQYNKNKTGKKPQPQKV